MKICSSWQFLAKWVADPECYRRLLRRSLPLAPRNDKSGLWNGVSDDQLRTVGSCIARIETDIVFTEIIIIVECKAQAQLRDSCQIDEAKISAAQCRAIPAGDGCVRHDHPAWFAGTRLKVC